MTYSPLIAYTVPFRDEYDSRRGALISRINVHHWAGAWGGDAPLLAPGAPSANYIIQPDGTIVGQVPEGLRAWTSGSWEADAPAITVEVANAPGAGPVNNSHDHPDAWRVTDAAYDALCRLVADIGQRYGWHDFGPARIRGHREFVSTACPGGWLWTRIQNGDIRARAQQITTTIITKPLSFGGNMFILSNDKAPDQLVLVTVDGGQFRARYLEDPVERATILAIAPPLPRSLCDEQTMNMFLDRAGYEYGQPVPPLKVQVAG